MGAASVYHVGNKNCSRLKLFRSENGIFKVIEFDEFPLIISGHEHTLVRNDIAETLHSILRNEIRLESVSIERQSTGDKWNDYSEVIIGNEIFPEKISSDMILDENVWIYDNCIFVSQNVKDQLETLAGDRLMFSEGFSRFA
ncbi:MAG: hypothetical protein GC178_08745 [Flavobacteriales bacterium]|nr:hypothetical protein [Flavobacteriales bacterium]